MICEKQNCFGCYACYNICPKKAIQMIENSNGYVYPKIDENKCINCNLCKKVCQGNKKNQNNLYNIGKCYSAYAKESEIQENSTSGGIATVISRYFVNNNGVVYGAYFNSVTNNVEHIRCIDSYDIEKIKGSKYIQSNMNMVYKNVKEDIEKNKKVLFIGTPCQISGLMYFLNFKRFENLFTIDLLCHGISNKKNLSEDIEIKNLKNIKFRKNTEYCIEAKYQNNDIINVNFKDSVFLNLFLNSYLLRPTCDKCQFSKTKRIGDISLGDFWKLNSKNIKDKAIKNGISIILVNSEKGRKILNLVKNDIYIFEEDLQEAQKNNEALKEKKDVSIKIQIFRILGNFLGPKMVYKILKIKRKMCTKNDK